MTAIDIDTKSPAFAGFKELATLAQAENNIKARLSVLGAELREVGWRGRPPIEGIPGVRNGTPGVAPSGRVGELLRDIPREQTAAAREGRQPDIKGIEAELEQVEHRSAELRAEIAVLAREHHGLPEQREAVVRRHYSAFCAHARQVAAERAAHADQFVAMARLVLDHRAEVYEALVLARTGRPRAITEAQWGAMSSHLVGSLAPWTDANHPALIDLWRAIETVAGASTFAVTEPHTREAA